VVVANIPDDTDVEDIVADDIQASVDDLDDDDDSKKTRYQRTTGVPLKERIKIARMSG
jgi:hypothetical protein